MQNIDSHAYSDDVFAFCFFKSFFLVVNCYAKKQQPKNNQCIKTVTAGTNSVIQAVLFIYTNSIPNVF